MYQNLQYMLDVSQSNSPSSLSIGPSPTISPVNQLRIGIERKTRSVIVGCGGRASARGRSLVRRNVGMCVMNSLSGAARDASSFMELGRRCKTPWSVLAPDVHVDEVNESCWRDGVAVAVADVAVDVVVASSMVEESFDWPSSSATSGTLERLFMAKDRGRVMRSWSLVALDRNAVECEEVRVRAARWGRVFVELAGIGASSTGPWP